MILGIRPEDFEDASMVPNTPTDRRLRAQVTLVEALGSELIVHFGLDARAVDSGDPDALEEATAVMTGDAESVAVGRFSARARVRIGDTLEIAVSTENLHFFDPQTRLAIWN